MRKQIPIMIGILMCQVLVYADTSLEFQADQKWNGQAVMEFSGKSTLHDFSGHAPCEPFVWEIVTDPNSHELIINSEIDVQVQKMDTDNKKRDKNMRSMFEADKFTTIHGQVAGVRLAAFKPVAVESKSNHSIRIVPGSLPIELQIRDTKRKVLADVSQFRASSKDITFAIDFDVSLKEFNLEAPTVMKIIRVGDTVRLRGIVTLRPESAKNTPLTTRVQADETVSQHSTADLPAR